MTSPWPRVVAGVDGGGSGSRVLVLDAHGKELGRAQGPPALLDPHAVHETMAGLAGTIRAALSSAAASSPVAALWAGLAGAGDPKLRATAEDGLRSSGLAESVRVGTDAEAARWDAFGPEPGFVLASGTGTVVCGRNPDGEEIRVGGWGHPLGDEGSGYWIGLQGLRAVARAWDGRGPETSLTETLMRALPASHPRELPAWVSQASKKDVGDLAPRVLSQARQGDAAARAIVERACQHLIQHLDAALARLGSRRDDLPVALAGGLMTDGSLLRHEVATILRHRGTVILSREIVPARGAARLALTLMEKDRVP